MSSEIGDDAWNDLAPTPTSGNEWPPRFHFTAEEIAALFLRKHFGDSAGMPQVTELAEIIKSAVQNAIPPTSGNDEVEAMCKELTKNKGIAPTVVGNQYLHEVAALLRKQAAQIDHLVRLNKSTLETAAEQIAELQTASKDAERYRWLRLDRSLTDRGMLTVIEPHHPPLRVSGDELDAKVDSAIAKEATQTADSETVAPPGTE